MKLQELVLPFGGNLDVWHRLVLLSFSRTEGRDYDPAPSGESKSYANASYHQAEFVALKAEIAELIKGGTANFQFAVIASAGIFAWIAGAEKINGADRLMALREGVLQYIFWLPATVTAFFALLSLGLSIRIGEIATYLIKLESRLGEKRSSDEDQKSLGWEFFFKNRVRVFGILYIVGWLVLFVGNICLAIDLPGKSSGCSPKPAATASAHSDVAPCTPTK